MEGDSEVEDRRTSLEKFQELVVQRLRVGDVIPYMIESGFPKEFASQLRTIDRRESSLIAARKLVDFVLRDDSNRMVSSLYYALEEAEYEHLIRILKGYTTVDPMTKDIFEKLMDCNYRKLLVVKAVDIAPDLKAEGCISKEDVQQIEADSRNLGNYQAVQTLLNFVTRKKENWFECFMAVLKRHSYEEIVVKILPELQDACSEASMIHVTGALKQLISDPSNPEAYQSDPKKLAKLQEEPDLPVPCATTQSPTRTCTTAPTDSQTITESLLQYESVGAAAEQPLLDMPEEPPLRREAPDGANAPEEPNNGRNPDETLVKRPVGGSATTFCHGGGSGADEGLSLSLPFGSGTSSPHHDVNINTDDETKLKQLVKRKDMPDVMCSSPNISGPATSSQNGDSLGSGLTLSASHSSNDTSVQNQSLYSRTDEIDDEVKMNNFGAALPARDALSQSRGSAQDELNVTGDQSEELVEELELRGYQYELAQEALEGKNVLVEAPTGSGKTHVALYISKEHLEMGPGMHRVVFLVPTVALVDQQCEQYHRYLKEFKSIGISGEIQAAAKVPLGDVIPQYDVMVMTPQILVDALEKEEMSSISQFTLMIFDECHHTNKNHPYNTIMSHYLKQKLSPDVRQNSDLPQVIGLTASVGVGKARNIDGAVDHILKLCANMDAHALSSVSVHKEELQQHVNNPDERSEEVRGRMEDPFQKDIERLMLAIELKMKGSPEVQNVKEIKDFEQHLAAPSDRGSTRYTQWVSMLRRKVACIYIQQQRRLFVACINHLNIYNNAMMINADCRTKDAIDYIKKEFSELRREYFDETDEWLEKIFKDREEILNRVSANPRYKNPKLQRLKKVILSYVEKTPDLRGIIFCKTRDMTQALQNWMMETEELKGLNAKRLTGTNAAADKAGMTQVQQVDALKYFKEGKHKIIIATTVAEEGLDIQKCNLVIRYEHVTNEIAMVQARGRGRAKDAQYVLVAEKGKGTAEKEEFNKIREIMMKKAMVKIQNMPKEEFSRRVEKHQHEAQLERRMAEHEKRTKEKRKRGLREDLYELRCMKCDTLGCLSENLRTVSDVHHFVFDKDFNDRIKVEPHPKPASIDAKKEIYMTGKIFCIKCGTDWGVMATYRKAPFPVLKIASFVLVDMRERRTTCKKWKDSPFRVEGLTPEVLDEYLNGIDRDDSESD